MSRTSFWITLNISILVVGVDDGKGTIILMKNIYPTEIITFFKRIQLKVSLLY